MGSGGSASLPNVVGLLGSPQALGGQGGDWGASASGLKLSSQTAPTTYVHEKTLTSKCLVGAAVGGKFVKTHTPALDALGLGGVAVAANARRMIPLLDSGLRRRLSGMGEPLVSEWLQWYPCALPPALAAAADGHSQIFVGR